MISVVGTGRWGTFLAWYCAEKLNQEVVLIGRDEQSKSYTGLLETGENSFIKLPADVRLSCDKTFLKNAKYIIISIHSQELRGFLYNINREIIQNKKVILCMKGLEIHTGKRLTEIFREETGNATVGALLGPGHVQEIYAGIPTCMVVDSDSESYKQEMCKLFNTSLIRIYKGNDLIGNETGAAAKNVIGIAAGFLDALGLGQLKGALMARGCYEIGKIIKALGGRFISAYGLAHLGDYEATLFSPHSRNRRFGENFVRGREGDFYAEGVETCRALYEISQKRGIDAPIVENVYRAIFGGEDPETLIYRLLYRDVKHEFMPDLLE
ncbi:MAG: glycerol-3-phosphate dehydrogenase [Oscillospiraceae bacterium]|jgi:glycerol-3-phosphate dehydrogenase (NAD(P)+)|nr:glycerol-3-phosphate dehydrogenase [Oscillospiraceae bacterium]